LLSANENEKPKTIFYTFLISARQLKLIFHKAYPMDFYFERLARSVSKGQREVPGKQIKLWPQFVFHSLACSKKQKTKGKKQQHKAKAKASEKSNSKSKAVRQQGKQTNLRRSASNDVSGNVVSKIYSLQ